MPELESWLAESTARLRPPDQPLVTLTYAQSLDGSISAARGRPLGLSGEESRRMTHWLRTQHDALLVGIGTLLADDPQLTVRYADGDPPRPIIVDSHLRTPPTARVLAHSQKPLIAALKSSARSRWSTLVEAGAEILPVLPDREGNVSLPDLLGKLGGLGIRSVMVEGGTRIITAFLRLGLCDRLIVTVAPVFVGGPHAVEGWSTQSFPRLNHTTSAQYGEDVVIWGEFQSR